jgi:PAS domain S-box-containing protein
MTDITFEQYQKQVEGKIKKLLPIFAKAAIGDFSEDIEIPEKEDEFTQLYVGLQIILEVIREKIREQQHLNEQLKKRSEKSELEKFRDEAIIENIGEGLIATDQQGKVLLFNKTAESLLGISSEEVIGKSLVDVVPMERENGTKLTAEDRPMTQTLTNGRKTSGTYYYIRSDKVRFPAGIVVTPVLMNGTVVGSIEIFRDMTTEKELERMKDEFVSMSSHELRTPMTAIKGFVSMILRGDFGPISPEVRTPLTTVANSTERLIALVNNLLDVSRIEAGKVLYTLENVVIDQVISQVIEALYPLTHQKGITIEFHSHKPIFVQTDIEKLKEILNNLIGNALKFTDKGAIRIHVEEVEEWAHISVEDTGLGIAPEDQNRLFQRFDQITTQQKGKPVGSGLGLYISLELARKMGGNIWLEKSEPLVGSTFVVSVPLADTNVAQQVKKVVMKAS